MAREEAGVAGGRERQRSLMRRSSRSRQVGMMASRSSDQMTRTRSSRCRKGGVRSESREERRGTNYEGSALVLLCVWEHVHGVEDLDAGVGVDVDALVVEGDVCESGMDGGAAHFDSDDGVEEGDGLLEGLEGDVFVGEYAKFSGEDAEGDAGREVVL